MISRETAIAFVLAAAPSCALAVQWESQADRLQNISAAIIDAVPVPRPTKFNNFGIGMSSDISLLPKINTTVGAKTEKVPQAKFHLIPNVEIAGGTTIGKSFGLGGRAYGGFLPPVPKFLSGIDAKLTQHDYGAILDGTSLLSRGLMAFVQVGWHATGAKVKGRIASTTGEDDAFESRTRLIHLTVGGMHRKTKVYAAYLIGYKNTKSKLYIKEDDTDLSVEDSLADANVPLLSQGTLGWLSPYGVTAALSFLYVPNRFFMPRLSFGYVHHFLDPSAKDRVPHGEAALEAGAADPEARASPGGGAAPADPTMPATPPATGSSVPLPPADVPASATTPAPATDSTGQGKPARVRVPKVLQKE